MPNKPSAAKRDRQNTKRRLRNKMVKTRVRSAIRTLREAVTRNAPEEAHAQLQLVTGELDRAVRKGVLHRNTAARHKKRLSARLKALRGAPAAKSEERAPVANLSEQSEA